MLPEIGHFALVLAFGVALLLALLPLAGAARHHGGWMALARPAALALFVFAATAFGCLAASFGLHDYSLTLVASHSHRDLPLTYRLAATWGSHEGSMLLWVLMLSGWTFAVSRLSRSLPAVMRARVLATLGLVASGFLAFVLFTSNPFQRLLPPALEGRDLNPLLQDPGMVFHPPLLYMGYVGFAVAFAFAVAALLGGRLDAAWARWSRPWTAAAWAFLTLGIALGSAWAYYELGWGGWWFWDPVENASFMPWLLGTALLHSLAVAEKRGAFKAWTVLLAIATFSCSLLGTFIVRSGVLTSVHAFATDPARGVFILAFLGVVVGGSLALYAWRAGRVGFGGPFETLSRETLLLVNNVLLGAAAGAVMLGTLYPLALDALGAGKISVGAPYFEAVFVPLMAPVLLLMGAGPLARWSHAPAPELARRLKGPALAAVAGALALPLAAGRFGAGVAFGLLLAGWVFATTALTVLLRARSGAGQLGRAPLSFWAMVLAHLGVGVFIVGVTLVRGWETERDVRLTVGEGVSLAGWRFTLDSVDEVRGPNYAALRATIGARPEAGGAALQLAPEKRVYHQQPMPTTEAAIDSSPWRDLYVALGEPIDPRTWTLRVHHKPFVSWIWAGALLMALGGACAVADRRYRVAARRPAAAAAVAGQKAAA